MKQRILTALILAPLAIGLLLYAPTRLLLPLVAALLLIGVWEWTRLIGFKTLFSRALLLLPPVALMAWLAQFGWPNLFPTAVLMGLLWWVGALVWLFFPQVGSRRTRGVRAWKYLIILFMVVPAWCALALLHAEPDHGPAWALFAVMIVWVADSGAYFAGSRWGQRKLAPKISPGKTWAGLWGGLATSLLLALMMALLMGFGVIETTSLLLATALTMLISVVGDLTESLIKRHAGAKDSGQLIPGHGGVLDRLDSLFAALPIFVVLQWTLL